MTGGEVHQGPDGGSNLYVTRGDGVNRRTGGRSGMWRCDIPDSNGVLQSIYIYVEQGVRYFMYTPSSGCCRLNLVAVNL